MKPRKVGRYRQRISVFDVPESSTDDYGQPSLAPDPIATIWAEVRPLKGQEQLNVRQLFPTATHIVECRWLGSLVAPSDDNPNGYIMPQMKLQVVKDGRILNVDNAYNVEERNICWQLTCTEKVGASS